MSAFVNPDSTEELTFPEQCPPKPDGSAYHEQDTVTIRTDFAYGDILFVRKMGQATPGILWDDEAATIGLLYRAITAWSFVHEDGTPVDVGIATIRLLREHIAEQIAEKADEHFQRARGELPNSSSVPSVASPSVTGSASSKRRKKR
jgi:hypothetical protein